MSGSPPKVGPAKRFKCMRCFDTGVVSGGGFNCAGSWVEHPARCGCEAGQRDNPFRGDRVWREG